MIKANFNTYASYITDSLYQWDINQVLSVSGLNLDVAPEIHFSNSNMDRAIVRQATLDKLIVSVNIPNSLLQEALTIKAHIGIYEGNTFKVVELIEIPVIAKTRPSDYKIENTDEEIYSFEALKNDIANMVTLKDYNANNSNISIAISSLDSELKARIDNIIAHNNDTEGNTELVDIRLGADNVTYDSAGSAVRGQFNNIRKEINHFYANDIFNQGYENLYPGGNIEQDYKGGTWKNEISESFSLAPGFYSIILPHIIANDISHLTIEYVGGLEDASLRILSSIRKPGIYSFEVTRDDLDIELRYMVANSNEQTPGIYGVYDIVIVAGDISDTVFIPDSITGVNNPLEKRIGKNLFNKDSEDNERGHYFVSNGEFRDSDSLYASHCIPVKPNTKYTLSNFGASGGYIVFYNTNDSVIGQSNSVDLNYSKYNETGVTFTTPSTAKYLRFSGRVDYLNDGTQLEEGEVVTSYEDYTEYLDLTELEKRVDILEDNQGLTTNYVKSKEVDTLNDGEYITLASNMDIKKNKTKAFYASITIFDSLKIGHGETSYGGNYVDIDNDNVTVYAYNNEASVVKTEAHGLTISDFISVVIDVNINANITIFTATGSFTLKDVAWSGCNGSVFAKSVGSVLTDCKYSWTISDIKEDIWIFGDSYLGLTNPARYPYHLLQMGFDKWLACGYPGGGSSAEKLSFTNLLAMAKPKYMVWCMGMNSPDNGDINTTWLTNTQAVLSLCNERNITPILATIPSVPDRDNSYKNDYVRNSGYRYIDFEKAVGADKDRAWFDGMLSGDNVHPSELGAKALASRFIIDVPEIAQN